MALSRRAALSANIAVLVCVLCLPAVYGAEEIEGTILTYNKKGADWPGMCQAGSAQSPINIVTKDMADIGSTAGMLHVESLGVVSGASMHLTTTLPHFEVTWEEFIEEPVIKVPARKKDGDVLAPVQSDLEDDELTMVKIEPKQFHFHNPSENSRDGQIMAGGLHIVSAVKKGESAACDKKIKAGSNCFVVLSVFLSEESFYSPFDSLFKKVTRSHQKKMRRGGDQQLPLGSVFPRLGQEAAAGIGFFDLNTLLPARADYATWAGSLTTFPCSEEILWVQFLNPVPITFNQVSAMRTTISKTYGDDCRTKLKGACRPFRRSFNNRAIQPINDRVLKWGMAF